MNKKRMFWIGGGLILIIIVIVASVMSGDKSEAVKVQVAKVNHQKIVETVASTGEIQPETQVKISADVAAKITRLDVKEGDWVEKGQFLVELDRERYIAAVENSQANANLVKENMIKAEKDYKRMKDLYDKNLESEANLEQAFASFKVESARYQSALAGLKQAKDDLSKTSIYSPMAGTVSQLNKELGEIALGSQFQEDVIMVISNLNNMEAVVDVDENDIVSVELGDKATIEVDALSDFPFKGTVSEIASSANVTAAGSADQKTEFEVKVRITNPGDKLRPGMTASADVVTEVNDNALVVPIQSVTVRTTEQLKGNSTKADSTEELKYKADKDGFVQVVFVVRDDEVQAVQVETGIQSETHIEILKGLEEGDEIVTGNYRAISQILQNNTKVEIDSSDGDGKKKDSGALARGN